ncbi:MAG: mechanosensitive ion channel [Ilumatobacter sp.]|nr:mechanosensitive ion channel [Ilumatobacter sp.]
MLHQLLDELAGHAVTQPGVVVIIIASAVLASRFARVVARRIIRRLAAHSRPGQGLWRTRARRIGGETTEAGEQRRRQRIDAASRMVSHLASVAIWLVATIVLFNRLDIDPAFFLSSAGFIGAGLAIGGQHKVNDYLTGLSVHFEDRYGVGDLIEADIGWSLPIRGVVDHVGLFSTRIRAADSTMHLPNNALVNVRNLSQEPTSVELSVRAPDDADADDVAAMLKRLAGSDGLTDVVFVGDLDAGRDEAGDVRVRAATACGLDERRRAELVNRAETALRP